MSLSEFELKRTNQRVAAFVEKHRLELHIRQDVDVRCRQDGQSVEIFEIRPVWNNPQERIEIPVAKATSGKTRQCWRIFWQRSDSKWHCYEASPEVRLGEKFRELVERDEYGCFFD